MEQSSQDIARSSEPFLPQRRGIVGLSLLGIASMAATTLLQTGIIKHLPDPPLRSFRSDKVNLSPEAYPLGVPDGPIALVSYALNLPLAAAGTADRATELPWIPILAAAKASVDALAALWYFYQMPAREKAWCIYCITAQLASLGVLALSIPEARRAVQRVKG